MSLEAAVEAGHQGAEAPGLGVAPADTQDPPPRKVGTSTAIPFQTGVTWGRQVPQQQPLQNLRLGGPLGQIRF